MIFSIIHLLVVSLLFLIPALLYKKTKPFMSSFYERMTYSIFYRKFFACILVLILILFHFVYYWTKPGEYGVMASTIILFYLFSTTRTQALLREIRNSKVITVFCFTVTLALLFTPHMYSFAVVLAFLLLAVSFYPSKQMEQTRKEQIHMENSDSVQIDSIKKYYR